MESLTHQSAGQMPAFILSSPQEENSFDFWGVLSRRKWLVFLGLVTGLALGGLYHAQCEEVYESKAQVKIEPKTPVSFRMTNTDLLAPNTAEFDIRHDRFIGGHNIVYKCLQENQLMDLPSFNDIPEAEVVDFVKKHLECAPDKEEQTLYDLKFYCNDQDDVSMVLNHLIVTYRNELDDQYKFEANKYTEMLENVKKLLDKRFEIANNELRTIQKSYDAAMLGSNVNVHQKALHDLDEAILQSRKHISEWTALRTATLSAIDSGPEAITAQYYNLVQQDQIKDFSRLDGAKGTSMIDMEIEKIEIEYQQMKMKLGSGHPDVRALRAAADSWKEYQAENQQGQNVLSNGDPQIALDRFLLSLDQRIADEQARLDLDVREYAKHEVEARRLQDVQREMDSIENEIADVNEMIKNAQMKIIETDPSMQVDSRAADEGYIFRVIENASKGRVVWPILPVILGIGGLLGLLGGFGLGCLVELADKTFHNPNEIMKQLQVPLIGHIPVIGQSKRYLVENSLIEPIVCTYHRPKSQVSEAFRAVRTSLYFNTQGKQHSVIQITSPTPGDGKSTLAANLAVSIAQSGKRVLLVDGDMRRPRQATTFGISSKTGFATVLAGESQWRDVVYECEEIEGLTVMPCGAKPNNPAELSSSPQVKELIEEMRQEFDFVIIDTPPMLAVTDACPIAARVDGVILCLRIKKNVRVSAERATEMLTNLGANCIGLVVNGVGAQSGYGSQYTYGAYRAGYSYNGYGYGYGYGYGAGKYYDDDRNNPTPANGGPKHIEQQRSEPPVV